ncbi:hypothetical protein DL767_010613 [Monosporascus sp. MG133]|nr:hypothetical protein DL767_010613 [Monosporascus sp. MG133]
MSSTKFPNVAGVHEDVPRISVGPPSESTPLLAGADETPGTPERAVGVSRRLRQDQDDLAEGGSDHRVACVTANVTCYAPMQGLATTLDTLCAQAYGSGHKHLVGLQLQRMTYFAAQRILVTPTSATYQIPFPVSIAASTRVANLIRAGLVDAAKTSAKVVR